MKKTYDIEVDCANCANKMGIAASKVSGVKSASISFMTQKLMIEFEDDINIEATMKEILKACRKVESDCVIYF